MARMPEGNDTTQFLRKRLSPKARQVSLRKRIQWIGWIMTVGLVLVGLSAIPLQSEINAVVRLLHVSEMSPERADSGFVKWLLTVRDGVSYNSTKFPFMAYGTDWLGFALVVLGLAFFGCVRHPLRNSWLFTVGMVASVLVIPWALILGEVRDIPLGWRFIDCALGVAGFIPCFLAVRWVRELDALLRAENAAS